MTNSAYQKFVKRWEAVIDLPPQTVGPLTPYYKMVVRRLKVMPWPLLLAVGLAVAASFYLILGSAITFLVSLLQKGF